MLRIFGLLAQGPVASREADTSVTADSDRDSASVPAVNPSETAAVAQAVEGAPVAEPVETAPAGNADEMAVMDTPAVTARRTAAKLRASGPRLFVQSNYVAAVRASDGAILSHGVAAMPADVIELYGTGFASTPSIDAEAGFTAAQATVRIGGAPADVRFAGPVGPGLYQIDVTVPAGLPTGDHPVIVSMGGMSTDGGALLKIAQTPDSWPQVEGRYSGFLRKAMDGTSAAATDCAPVS